MIYNTSFKMFEMLSRAELEQMSQAELAAELARADKEIEALKAKLVLDDAAAKASAARLADARAKLASKTAAAEEAEATLQRTRIAAAALQILAQMGY